MLYKEGDSVLISPKRVRVMNGDGKADIYLNTVMTIVEIRPGAYRMQEDNGRWAWDDSCIVRKTSNIGKKKNAEKILKYLKETQMSVRWKSGKSKFKLHTYKYTENEWELILKYRSGSFTSTKTSEKIVSNLVLSEDILSVIFSEDKKEIIEEKQEEKNNMLYKEGDRIILKSSKYINSVESDLWFNNQKEVEPLKEKIANKICTICSAGYKYYRLTTELHHDALYTYIPEEWIAGLVVNDPYSNDKYNKGDVVKIKACLFSIYNSGGLCKKEIDLNVITDLTDKCFTIKKKDERGYAVVESPYWIPESWIEKVIEEKSEKKDEEAIDIPDNIIKVKKILDSGKKAYVKNWDTYPFQIIENMDVDKENRIVHINCRRVDLAQAQATKSGYVWSALHTFEVFSERYKILAYINNKYNVGDIVNIRKDLKAGVFYSDTISCERMTTYEKKDRVIKEVNMRGEYRISDDPSEYLWGETMFEEKSSDLSPDKNFGYRVDFPFDMHQEYRVSTFLDTDPSKKVENENYPIKKITHTRLKSERVKSKEYTPKTGLYKKVKY